MRSGTRHLVQEGLDLIGNAMAEGQVGPYQLQAAIAALHDEAPTTGANRLAADQRAVRPARAHEATIPMVALNRAVAIAMVEGPEAGLKRSERDREGRATEGPLSRRRRARPPATSARAGAIWRSSTINVPPRRTASLPERNYLLSKAARLAQSNR